jgi:hypothetical protein
MAQHNVRPGLRPMETGYIIKTNYFNRPWTWIKRYFEFLAALGFLFWTYILESDDPGSMYPWIKYSLFGLLTFYIFSRPKDELAVDEENLHYIKKSIVPFFNRMTKYKISEIKSIGCGGVYHINTEFLLKGNRYRNRLEIVFKDNSSKSHEVTIYKTELKAIVKGVQMLINRYDRRDYKKLGSST